jgi:hypothetical protein
MRPFSLAIALAALVLSIAHDSASAQDVADPAEIQAARRALEAAKIEARHYWQIEYQCDKRELDAAIRVSDEEVRTMRRQLRRFGPFHAFAYGQQPAFEYRNARLCLAEAEARRRLLIDERNDLARSHGDHLALLNLNVAEARARLVALEGGGIIELDVVQSDRTLPLER